MVRIVSLIGLVFLFTTAVRADFDNPIYQSWASHKVGTKVKSTIFRLSDKGVRTNTYEVVETLVELTPTSAKTESKMTDLRKKTEGKVKPHEFAAKLKEPFKESSFKTETKDQPVKVGEKTYNCVLREDSITLTGGSNFSTKVWLSADVPGRKVKTEQHLGEKMADSTVMTGSEVTEIIEK